MRGPLLYSGNQGIVRVAMTLGPQAAWTRPSIQNRNKSAEAPPALPDLFHSTIFDTIPEGTTVRDMTLAISIDMDTYLPRSIIIYCNTPTYGRNFGSS